MKLIFLQLQKNDSSKSFAYAQASKIFKKAEAARKKIADRIKVVTPDKYINTLGGVLAIAADANWENPTFMHGVYWLANAVEWLAGPIHG